MKKFDRASVLGIVPARSGSKRLPKKNLLPFRGEPLVLRTLRAAQESGRIGRLFVSTDGDDIAAACRLHGAEVPFLRPDALATDDASSLDVVFHVLEELAKRDGYVPAVVVLLQPTSPLRTAAHVASALDAFEAQDGKGALVSVTDVKPPTWTYCMDPRGALAPAVAAGAVAPLASGARYVQPNGAIYVASPAYLRRYDGFMGPETVGFPMHRESSVDIDTAEDLRLAEVLAEHGSPSPPPPPPARSR